MFRLLLFSLLVFVAAEVQGRKRGYRKATEGQVVVLDKLFPKTRNLEVSANLGGVINQSYIDTFLLHGSLGYNFSEVWGITLEGLFAVANQDKKERACLESFYNIVSEMRGKTSASCASESPDRAEDTKKTSEGGRPLVNIGPAYVPITEIKQVFTLNAVWTPIYGKQIFSFLPRTSHMDIFLAMGGGIANIKSYKEKSELKPGVCARTKCGSDPKDGRIDTDDIEIPEGIGVSHTEENLYGEAGRPEPVDEAKPLITFGVGQKYYFAHRMFIRAEFRNYTLVGTDDGYYSFFALWGGVGVKF